MAAAASPDAPAPNPNVPNPDRRDVLRYARQALVLVGQTSPRPVVMIAVLTVVIAVIPAGMAYVGKLLIDAVVAAIASGDEATRRMAMIWAGVETGLLALQLVARRVQAFHKRILQAELGYAVNRRIQAKTMRLDLAVIELPIVQQRIAIARQHAAVRPYSFINRLFDAAQFIITLLTFAAVLWTFSPWAVLLVLAGGMPLFAAELRYSSAFFRFYTGRTPQMRRRSYLEGLMTSDAAAPERIHSGAGAGIEGRYTALYDTLFGIDRDLQARRSVSGSLLVLLGSGAFLAGKLWVVWEAIAGAVTLGAMTMYIALLKQGQNTVIALLTTLGGGYEDLLYLSNLDALESEPEGRARGTAVQGAVPGEGFRLRDVSYTYPGSTRAALEGVSFAIPLGTQVGIVGANGSGKSTLVKLLTGLYLPTAGSITLDGTDISQWSPEALHARSAVLFQPFQRYQFTVGENIAMGEGLRVTDPERIAAAARAGLAQPVLEDLPQGMDTLLSRQVLGGRELSGGQWQRLALARAMLRTGADVLILDEPTAALDPAGEETLLEAARQDHRTLIIISHRLSNLRHADHIVVLDKGRVIESGTHDELIALGKTYRTLFKTQVRFYAQL